ncbi:MAG: SEC-C domain-containing protein [Tissierellia bacterium]|nr:SEC-C domain-containing protein [Tissierellia bacterium]
MMSLYKQWTEKLESINTQEEYQAFFEDFMSKETECYRNILQEKDPLIEGTIKDLAEKNNMTSLEFLGFLDGANSSFQEPLTLDNLKEETEIKATLDFEKLLWNMHDANAEWLYEMEEWENIFNKEKRKQIRKEYNRSKIVVKGEKVGRNDPCPCGSGVKYKKCCGK